MADLVGHGVGDGVFREHLQFDDLDVRVGRNVLTTSGFLERLVGSRGVRRDVDVVGERRRAVLLAASESLVGADQALRR